MDEIIYAKYSNERADRFNIRTMIVKNENGEKCIRKLPLTEAAKKHIGNISRYYELLAKNYLNDKISINKYKKIQDGIEFEYIEGNTLEDKLDELLFNKEYMQVVEVIKEYVAVISNVKQMESFQMTTEFIEVFGKVDLPCTLEASYVNNIDLIFSNIIIQDKWHVIDYEWTFECLIPINYIIYRALHYYMYGSSNRHEAITLGLYKLFNITEQEISQYENMEKQFQSYILGATVPTRILYPVMASNNYYIQDIISRQMEDMKKYTIQVFYDYGEGFNEVNSYIFGLSKDYMGKVSFDVIIPANIKSLRIDPAADNCIVKIHQLIGYSTVYYEVAYTSNGKAITGDTVLFSTVDPQIIITDLKDNTSKLEISFEVQILSQQLLLEISKLLDVHEEISISEQMLELDNDRLQLELEEKMYLINQLQIDLQEKANIISESNTLMNKYVNSLHELNDVIKEQSDYICEIHETKVWKIYKKYRKILNKK